MLARDARDSLAAVELVLAQPAISSQLIDNLNASIHVRALLTDLFLIDEILKGNQSQETSQASGRPNNPKLSQLTGSNARVRHSNRSKLEPST